MKNFSQIINEASRYQDAEEMLRADITKYNTALKKSLPVDVQKAIYLTAKYGINSAEKLDKIRTANKSKLKDMVDEFNIPLNELTDLWNLMKSIKQNYKVMPQYLTATERKLLEKGKLAMDDATIDLTSKAGRDAAAKRYMPLVIAIVNKMDKQSKLSRADLISAGTLGLSNAMNDWKREPDSKTGRVVSFKTYAASRIRQQILNDMDGLSHTLSGTNWYATKKARDGENVTLDAVSFDALTQGDIDHLDALGVEDRDIDDNPKWKALYKALDKRFTQRDTDIFYRFFGVNGRKKEKSKDIAKSYGMSEGNIQNSIIKKMLKYIKNDPKLTDILQDILDIYTESLMAGFVGASKEQIFETLVSDDVYLMLEDLNRWNNKSSFEKAYKFATSTLTSKEKTVINQAIKLGFNEIDDNIRRYKPIYIKFLRALDPTSSTNYTDVDIIENMISISELILKYKL